MAHLSLTVPALVLLALFHVSLQRDCFTSQCHHDNTWNECIMGAWNCHTDEFCQVETTHIENEHPFLTMKCKITDDELLLCEELEANFTTPECRPDQLTAECYWCCPDEDCVRGLVPAA